MYVFAFRTRRNGPMIWWIDCARWSNNCLRLGVNELHDAQRDLSGLNPILTVKQGLATVPQFSKRLEGQMGVILAQHRHRIHATLAQLNTLSPLAILGRGYSILQTVPAGQILRRASDVEVGQELEAQLASGRLSCKVMRVCDDSSV